jgi:hypothetical protein
MQQPAITEKGAVLAAKIRERKHALRVMLHIPNEIDINHMQRHQRHEQHTKAWPQQSAYPGDQQNTVPLDLNKNGP